MRTVIVGDVHGCYAELLKLLEVARVRDDDLLVSVGDLVDRGPQPLEVIQLFRARVHAKVLMGNHERKHVRAVFSYAQQITRLQANAPVLPKRIPSDPARQRELVLSAYRSTLILELGQDESKLPSGFLELLFASRSDSC